MASQVEASLLMWGLFWKVGLLVQSCLYHFYRQKGYGSKVFSKNGQFSIDVPPRYSSRWFQGITILGFCFARGKGLAGLKLLASLDAYQITNYQFLQKFIFSFAWFLKNSRNDFWIRNFKANCLSRRDQKVSLIFQNRAPWGTMFFFIQMIP